MVALRHKETRGLAIVPERKIEEFLACGYDYEAHEKQEQPKKSRKKKVTENATDADRGLSKS